MLIEILGAQKQRISRLGVELKHVNGAGNKNKKGETESSITQTCSEIKSKSKQLHLLNWRVSFTGFYFQKKNPQKKLRN